MAAVVLAGCKEYDDSDIRDEVKKLKDRVTTLEDANESLSEMLEQGALIKSVTPLTTAPGGWRIEFTGGDPSYVDIMNGTDGNHDNHGVTPMIEVRQGTDGSVTIWYNATSGYPTEEWVNTGVDIKGTQGNIGETGATGTPPEIKVVE